MHRVIYVSRASRFFTAQGIEALNVTCRQNNTEVDVTGILVYHEGRFFQVLEGEEAALMQLMQVITKDTRHMDLRLVEHGPIQSRAFPGWHMGYAMPPDLPRMPTAAFALQDLLPPNSQFRGRDPGVRNHVRMFLSSLRKLPQAATG